MLHNAQFNLGSSDYRSKTLFFSPIQLCHCRLKSKINYHFLKFLFWTFGDVWPGFQSQGRLIPFPPACNGFLTFTSSATPAELLEASMRNCLTYLYFEGKDRKVKRKKSGH